MVKIELFDFQEEASLKLIEITSNKESKQTVLMKAPTASGKTIILIDYIDKYLNNVNSNTAFIWLCPGKGNLEEQSREKMIKFSPDKKTQDLSEALLSGFEAGTTIFINWELVTNKGNLAIRESEKKNLFERIDEAKKKGIEFIILIDEEHENNTSKADDIINSFLAKNIIRVSATVLKNSRFEYFEIDETDVIASGLITKAIYVNEDITDNADIDNDYDTLLNLADKKRISITERYKEIGKNIRPLVLIQFPNGKPETIELVEKKLEKMGYTYNNGMVAIWMTDDNKRGVDDSFHDNDGTPIFLLMKQAISTGWDCPRAKILVKLREKISENFTIQTIGRIRRMPEAKHYDDDLLDFCYVYTFDEKYKEGLLSSVDKTYETRRLFLKEKCKTFTLEKQTKSPEIYSLGEREILKKVYNHFVEKYNLEKDVNKNKTKLEANDYVFGKEIVRNILHGKFIKLTSMLADSADFVRTKTKVNTHEHGIYMLHVIDNIRRAVAMESNRVVRTILERLFRNNLYEFGKYKLLQLDLAEFYAFLINNESKLKDDFREITTEISNQTQFVYHPKKEEFKIPLQDFFKYDPNVKNEVEYLSNAYKNYTSGNATSIIRSHSEMLFEKHCEKRDDIEWIYKNGDSGQQYFSIVYIDGFQKQWLFYADYIVMKKDGSVWVIETKGGESHGESKNIDRQIKNKFNAFKQYAKEQNINWGFVRDKDGELYINNTEYFEDMANENWVEITEKF